MNKKWKFRIIFSSVIIALILISLLFNDIYKYSQELSKIKESAVFFLDEEYPEYEFKVIEVTYYGDRYSVAFEVNNPKLSSVKIWCYVFPQLAEENGYYVTKIFSTTNIDLLEKTQGDSSVVQTQGDGSIVR